MFIQKFYMFIFDVKLLFKSPLLFFYKWRSLIEDALWIHKNISIRIDGHKFTLPNYVSSVSVLEEIYVDRFYTMLSWCNCMLDIWWYMWDTGVYLSKRNKKVVIFEINPYNYEFLIKNTQWISNILKFNVWVSSSHKSEIIFSSDHVYSMLWSHSSLVQHHKKINISVKNMYILDIIKSYKPDGIKIDIEWWEYELVNELLEANIFPFNTWFIEFHIIPGKEQYCDDIIKKTLKFLYDNTYTLHFCDMIKKRLFTPNSLITYDYPHSECFFIVFIK